MLQHLLIHAKVRVRHPIDREASLHVLAYSCALPFADPAFGAASSAVATANAIVDDTSAAGGTITKFVINDSNDLNVLNGSVTVVSGGGDIELSAVIIDALSTVSMTSLTYTAPA